MKNEGFIYIFTGHGKGKTTAAIGIAIRAAGSGKKVAFLQFLKAGKFICSEESILKSIKNIKFIKFSEPSPIFNKKTNLRKLRLTSKKHIEIAVNLINSGKYDVVVLDELTYHFKYKTISVQEFLNKIKNRPDFVAIIITGRYAAKELVNKSDLVSEIKKIKHPFDKGIKAIKGIDF